MDFKVFLFVPENYSIVLVETSPKIASIFARANKSCYPDETELFVGSEACDDDIVRPRPRRSTHFMVGRRYVRDF